MTGRWRRRVGRDVSSTSARGGGRRARARGAPPRRDRGGRSSRRVATPSEARRRRRSRPRNGEGVVEVTLLLGEEALGVERAHAARAGGGHGLPVDVVLHVADREHARDVRLGRARLRDQVAGLVVVELVEEELRVRVVADRHEEPVGRVVDHLVGLDVPEPDAGELALLDAEHVLDDVRASGTRSSRSRGRGRS